MNFNEKVRAMALRLIGNNDAVKAATEPKVYIALLTQSGTDAPVATVLKNTLGGEVVWSYDAVGQYEGTLVGAFTANKTAIFHNLPFQQSSDEILIKVVTNGEDIIRVGVVNDAFASFNGIDSLSIKIEVYP